MWLSFLSDTLTLIFLSYHFHNDISYVILDNRSFIQSSNLFSLKHHQNCLFSNSYFVVKTITAHPLPHFIHFHPTFPSSLWPSSYCVCVCGLCKYVLCLIPSPSVPSLWLDLFILTVGLITHVFHIRNLICRTGNMKEMFKFRIILLEIWGRAGWQNCSCKHLKHISLYITPNLISNVFIIFFSWAHF